MQVDESSVNEYDEDEGERVWIGPSYEQYDEDSQAEEVTVCAEDSDCPDHPFFICKAKACVHKGIFPIYGSEFAGIIVLTVLIALANVGGVGGGGLIIPIIMALFSFHTKEAIAISGFTIFTGSVARFIYSYNQRHPEKDATMIDYGIVIVMMPLVLVGSFVGVLVNIMLPPILLSLFLTVILLLLTGQSFLKGRQIYQKESVQIQLRESELSRRALSPQAQEVVSPPGTTKRNYQQF